MTKEEEKYTTLDTEQCKWWVNTLFNMAKEDACNSHNFNDAREMQSAQDKIITALEQQPSEDCVSRQAVIGTIYTECKGDKLDIDFAKVLLLQRAIKALPPVTPTHCIAEVKFSKDELREICNERIEIACEHGTCKDCINHGINKEHTDIDGARYCSSFRNYTGYDFYCAGFEKRNIRE